MFVLGNLAARSNVTKREPVKSEIEVDVEVIAVSGYRVV